MKELQKVLAELAAYPEVARRQRHYEGLRWEAEHKDAIESKLQTILTADVFLDAVEEIPHEAIDTCIKYLHDEDWAALGRLIGGLENGNDGVRTASADGLLAMRNNDQSLQPLIAQFAQERLPREPRESIRALLQQLATN